MNFGSTSILKGAGELPKVALKFWETANFVLIATINIRRTELKPEKSGDILDELMLLKYREAAKRLH